MKANELRIGNYINYEQTTHVVIGFDLYGIISYWLNGDDKLDHYRTKIDEVKPIPLTEEWLLKFGFVLHDDDNFWFYKHGLDFCVTKDKGSFFVWIMDGDFVEIISVHQLQNLYFALIRKELEFN